MPHRSLTRLVQSVKIGGYWRLVTLPSPADPFEAAATAIRMLKWLQLNGFTQSKTVTAAVNEALEEGIPHRQGTAPRIVTQAMVRACFAATLLKKGSLARSIALLQPLRSAANAMAPALAELDTAFAKENRGATFAALGNDVVAAVERLGKKLQSFRGVEAPTTSSKWKRFVGETALALEKARMPMSEIASLFSTPETKEQVQENLGRRARRTHARKKQAARGARK